MSMDAFLAEYYGTNKTASAQQEDLESQKTIDLFCKLAADQNIDLKSMKDEDVQQLYNGFVSKLAAPAAKTASEEEEKKKEHEEKEEAAKKEHEEKHAMAKKAEEADAMGRIMAHAYVQELRKIASATKEAELPPALLAHMKGKKDDHDADDKGKHEPPPHEDKKDEKKDDKDEEKKASGSAFDDLAHAAAVKMAADSKFDPKEADQKVAAVRILGLAPETTKTASAPYEQAIGIRALELLEKAGYPVQWTE